MDRSQAIALAEKELQVYRDLSYAEIAQRIGRCEHYERISDAGETYQIQFDFFFDDAEEKNIRVGGSVSYSGWTNFFPVSSDFIIAPDGSFIGE